jgi:hypothetical protein
MRIETFSFGTITIDGEDYRNDLVLLPPRVISGWWRKEGHKLSIEDLAEAIAYQPDVLVVGNGFSCMIRVPKSIIRDMESSGLRVEVFTTDQACHRFNALTEEGQKVAGTFHLTC